MRVKIKPLSVNDAWKGRRYKTKDYLKFERDLLFLLPNKYKIPDGKLEIILRFGFSSNGSDWDNPIKPIQDVLQKKYNFNDNRVFRGTIEKEIVKKGNEFFEFEIIEFKH